MTMKMKTALAAAAFVALAAPSHAATLASWVSTNGETLAPTTLAPGVSGGTIVRGFGLNQNTGGTFNSNGWTIGGSAFVAFTNGDFLASDTITFDDAVDLTSLDLAYDRSNSGPNAISIDIAVNGAVFFDFFVDTAVAENSTSTASLDLSAFGAVTSFGFVILGYNATLEAGTFDLENRLTGGQAVVLSGELSPSAVIPLPAAGLLLLGGLGGLALVKRRRGA